MRFLMVPVFLLFMQCASAPQSSGPLGGSAASTPYGLPPFIPVTERASVSQIVLIADVVASSSRTLNQTIDSAVVILNVVDVLKKPEGLVIPERLALQFVLYPGSFEARMRTPPERGRYFVFLNAELAAKRGGEDSLTLFRLYEPNPFAFDVWNREGEAELRRSL